jgi:hypothetical protein
MDNNQQKLFKKILITVLSILPLVWTPASYAASTTINLSPATGTYDIGKTFSVDLVIDGNGDAFNAAKATVQVSANMQVNDVFLGDCNFSFINTPTTTNPSFVGALLGESSEQCTVYTLSVTPLSSATGLITISDASVKKFGNAEEILQSVQNGTYTLNSATGSSSQGETPAQSTTTESSGQSVNEAASIIVPESEPGLTTVVLKVVDNNNNPIAGATVSLSTSEPTIAQSGTNTAYTTPAAQQNEATQTTPAAQFQATTDESGIAHITNVPAGVHTIEVKKDDEKQIANKIVNVPANERVMRLGIQEQKEAINWVQTAIIVITILAMVALVIIYFRNSLLKLLQRLVGKA